MLKQLTNSYSVTLIFIILTIIILIGFFIPFSTKNPIISSIPEKKYLVYNLSVDSLDIEYGNIGKNQNLSSILTEHVSAQIIDRIAKGTRELFDVRKIRSGGKYALIKSKDSLKRTLYFIYELNDVDFIVYDFKDSIRVYKDHKKVTKVIKAASGIITSSLWNAFAENKLDVNLGINMADVYAWTVDFYGLQRGDQFKMIYEEYSVEGVVIKTDRILASIFSSSGKNFYAFYFEQAGRGAYFDDNGQSLRRSFLKAPLRFSRISSRFSKSRIHPILRIPRPHFGVDYAAPRGTPVVALGDGRVLEAGWYGGYGRHISIRHNSTYTSSYAHLSKYESGIKSGVWVSQGEVIGYVGSSGLSTGSHLDFRVYKNGNPTDPLKLESPAANPIQLADMVKFKQMVVKMKLELDIK